jgi:hypothetical protein
MKDTLYTQKEVIHIKEFYHTEKKKATTKKKHNDFPCQNRYNIYIFIYIYIFTHEKNNRKNIQILIGFFPR